MVRSTGGVIQEPDDERNPDREFPMNMTFDEIAKHLGVCRARVQQIHNKALRKLRAGLKELA